MRVVAAFLPASLITLALFCLMQYLITGGHQPPVRADYPGFVDLIRLQPDNEDQQTPSRKHTLPRQQRVADDTPPALRPLTADVQPPELSPLSVARPQPLPLQIATAPYLGAFEKSKATGKLPTVKELNRSLSQTMTSNPEAPYSPTPARVGDDGEVFALLKIEPAYPRKAARDRQEGWVKVEFTITERGTVVDPVVVESRPRRVFNRSALAAIRKWRFKPRVVAGKPVASRATQVIEFRLAGR